MTAASASRRGRWSWKARRVWPNARTLDIGAYLRLGKGERKLGAHTKAYVLAETLEAVIGAVYLDGGYDATMKVVLHMFDDIPQSDE
jgi:dsRNA-specific ribonuclease